MPERDEGNDAPALDGLGQLDRLLEHRTRLGICVLLARGTRMTFARLKELLAETDGNLGANLQRLERAAYLRASKQFVERRPVTWYALTAAGRRALDRHLKGFDAIVRGVSSD